MPCVFCQIVKGEIPSHKIYEDDEHLAFLDIHPINPGHTLLIPKTHTENILDTSEQVLQDLILLAKKIGRAVTEATGAEGFNLSVNNGAAAGQVVPHLHFHIIPRKTSDRLRSWPSSAYQEGEAEKVVEEIRKNLKD